MKKLIIIVIALFILNNCGYSPIYSLKNGNLYIKEISQKNRNKLESKIINNIEKSSNKDSKNTIELKISSNRKIDIITKDEKGDPLKFQMTILLNINILKKNKYKMNKTKSFSAKFNYNNNTNKFSLKQYEKEIENILIKKVVEKFIVYLSEL